MLPALKKLVLSGTFLIISAVTIAQKQAHSRNLNRPLRCATMELMNESIKKDPSLPGKWKAEGQKQYKAYLQRRANERGMQVQAGEIVIPIVFHLVDSAAAQAWITDRDIYEQVEILNQAYSGEKADLYKNVIPDEIYKRVGRIPIRFVLARRTPSGTLTSGIERRVNATPDHKKIKSSSTGGLNAWDPDKYVNVWCGTFTGEDNDLLGVATFPFVDDEGPQGVVISIASLPFTSNVSRAYYPAYAEGATLAHEIGHYLYLWHTFGDDTECNNDDFRIQDGWPLPNGAGPEGDDTPEEKYSADSIFASYGNPSWNYTDGCANQSFGEMYGSFMNYFDDRALFMFSDGMRKRVEGCIDLYRPGLKSSNGATPPGSVADAFLVTVSPRGIPERRQYIENNTPLTAIVRNSGSSDLTRVTVNVKLDQTSVVSTTFPLNLGRGADTTLNLGAISAAAGTHVLTIYTSSPDNSEDRFTNNDTVQSFIYINRASIAAPFRESFSGTTFPPAGWQTWNPDDEITWTRSDASGYTLFGAATVTNFDYDNGGGQLDDLISPVINMGVFDSSMLSFQVAYAVYDTADVSVWDGLEVYVSADGGLSYQLAYKKTGDQLRTVVAAQQKSFVALPSRPLNWRLEKINLTPYILPGKNLLIKFRNTSAFGNNTYIDDINVSGFVIANRDVFPVSILNISDLLCAGEDPTPSLSFATSGKDALQSLKINYSVDNGDVSSVNWTGSLSRGQTAEIPLSPLTGLTPGNHILTIFTSAPNGQADQYPANDTIRKLFYVFGNVAAPVKEGFEGTSFPPATWAISNPDDGITWERTTNAADSGIGSMVIRNYDYAEPGNTDRFVSSIVSGNAAYDSLFVSFDYAYAVGTNASLPDTLELQVTTDCNRTSTTVWKKWGADLQTLLNPNGAGGGRFTPGSNDWLNARIYLSPIVGNNDFQVNFVSKSNKQNDLYIDNIQIYGKVVPPLLKQRGYLFYPNPFKQQFIIRNYEIPATLQSAAIYNSVGQLVWKKDYNGNAYTEMPVDLGPIAAGIYFVKLQYSNKTVVDRIVKQ